MRGRRPALDASFERRFLEKAKTIRANSRRLLSDRDSRSAISPDGLLRRLRDSRDFSCSGRQRAFLRVLKLGFKMRFHRQRYHCDSRGVALKKSSFIN